MTIKILQDTTINQIAAGEVVDRPLSVVKELVENSIDANATEIVVTLDRGGRTLISVSDNGDGIHNNELGLALTRHATSKLTDDDLSNILHMGFRGEALASIATVARVAITSRSKDSEQAWAVRIDDGPTSRVPVTIQPTPASHPQGTTVEVKELFCFMLNRVRFLKSEQVEVAACVELLNAIAVAHDNISVRMIHNGKTVFDVGNKLIGKDNSLQQRIGEVLGDEFIENAIYFDTNDKTFATENEKIRLYGYVSVPTHNRSKTSKLFTFVNKRFVRDNFLNKTIRVSYFNTLPQEHHPTVVLFLEVPVRSVDVNIHPNKAEVKFSDEKLIRGKIIQTIRDAISKARASTSISSTMISNVQKNIDQQQSIKQDTQYQSATQKYPLPLYDNIEHNAVSSFFNNTHSDDNKKVFIKDTTTSDILQCADTTTSDTQHHTNTNSIISKNALGTPIFQLGLKYIIAVNDKGLVIVDQHAAHERIIFQQQHYSTYQQQTTTPETLHDSATSTIPVQNLLVPIAVNFGAAHNDLLITNTNILSRVGISISDNKNEVLVHSVPVIPGSIDIISLLGDIVSDIDTYREIIESHTEKIYSTIACHSSIRAGRKLDISEMDMLLRLIEQTDFASQCNHGRPTYIELPITYIDKMFERV